ncbi:hypothetical protein NFI96_029661 [Prochilodus magdalenae]|nr:hypothetical protein NFI96_029661 [Prochilodus magdalenae]
MMSLSIYQRFRGYELMEKKRTETALKAGEDRAILLGLSMVFCSIMMYFVLCITVVRSYTDSVWTEESICTILNSSLSTEVNCSYSCGPDCWRSSRYPCLQVYVSINATGRVRLLSYNEEAQDVSSEVRLPSTIPVIQRAVVSSLWTIGRRLHHAGLHPQGPLPRLSLTPRHRHQTLQWCRTRLSWSDSEWQRVIFSDESRFSLVGDAQRIRVWRHRGQHRDERFVVTRPEGLVSLHLHPYRTICRNCVRMFKLHGMDYHRTPLGASTAPYRDVWHVGLANTAARLHHTERQTSCFYVPKCQKDHAAMQAMVVNISGKLKAQQQVKCYYDPAEQQGGALLSRLYGPSSILRSLFWPSCTLAGGSLIIFMVKLTQYLSILSEHLSKMPK